MDNFIEERRRAAIKNAMASSALSGFVPSAHGLLMYEKWIEGLDGNSIVAILKEHHRNMESAPGVVSDGKAKQNLLGLTDSGRLRNAEADITTFRMAELLLQ
jgi:hypothetical protein